MHLNLCFPKNIEKHCIVFSVFVIQWCSLVMIEQKKNLPTPCDIFGSKYKFEKDKLFCHMIDNPTYKALL